jgi:hypothetical protein
MKKVIAMVVAAVAVSATADITQFKWASGDVGNVTKGDYVLTVLQSSSSAPDILSFVSGGQIDISDLMAFSAIDVQTAAVAPFGTAYWSIANTIDGTASVAGMYAWAVVSPTRASFAEFQVGDTFSVTALSDVIEDLQPGTDPAATPQNFDPDTMTIGVSVIPEPATFGLMGVAGLGMFLARRKARR